MATIYISLTATGISRSNERDTVSIISKKNATELALECVNHTYGT